MSGLLYFLLPRYLVGSFSPRGALPYPSVLIPRNTPLPALTKKIFHTNKPGQRSVLVEIVEGAPTEAGECVHIGRCAVRGLPAKLPVRTPVEVTFRYEANGRLTVQVRIAEAQAELQHEISRDNMLSQTQLDAWRASISALPPVANDHHRVVPASVEEPTVV